MRTMAGFAALCAVAALTLGCQYTAPVKPPMGGLFSSYSAPMSTQFTGQSTPAKTGQASAESVLGLVAWGDCSLQTAAKNGGLATIDYCDYEYVNVVLGIYQKFTTKAHGN
jgi:hypothetical protein